MKVMHLIVCFFVLALFPVVAQAQNQHEMNAGALKNFKEADAALNKVYRALVLKIDAKSKVKLKLSQKAWIAFRDTEAELIADFEARGGSMAPMIYQGKRAAFTKERTKQLLKMLKEYGRSTGEP